jgi:outer membrane protein assembly factor BamB
MSPAACSSGLRYTSDLLRLPVTALLLFFGMAGSSGHAQEWSRFRGPNGSGVSNDDGYPAEFSREKGAVWRTPVRRGKSSPVLTSRHIFLTAFENKKLFTQCIDRGTGKLLWERSEDQPRTEDRNLLNEPAAITPVTDGERVYAFFADYGLIAYDSSGNLLWKTPLGPFTNVMGLAAAPILAGDSIILVADQQEESYIAAFDRRNGELRWKVPRDEKDGWATPILYGTEYILTASRGQLGAHRLDTGARSWSYDELSPAIVASPVLVDDTIYTFGYGNDAATPFSTVLARHDKNQDDKLSPDEYGSNAFLIGIGRYEGDRDRIVTKEEWDEKQRQVLAPSSLLAIRLEGDSAGRSGTSTRPREVWRYERSFVGVIPSPLFYNGVLYVMKNGGILTSFNPKTGSILKTGRVAGAIGGYSASPVAADGKIFLASEDGKVAVLRAGGDWDVLTVNDLGEACYATPALSQGSIYLRTAEALYRFGVAR